MAQQRRRRGRSSRRLVLRGRGRALLIAAAAVAATAIFLVVVDQHYPIRHWLFWRYLEAWAYSLGFLFGAVGVGSQIARPLLADRIPPLRERLVFEAAVGVVGMFSLIFIGGVIGILGPVFSVAMMAGAIAVGGPGLVARGRRFYWHWRAARARRPAPRPWWHVLSLVGGGVAIGLIYFSVLSPNNAAFDARFYHLAIAEQYAVTGAIRPPVEIWWPAALPQLASVVYAWCFSLPGLDMFSRVVCSAHVELVLFLVTLASVTVLVRRLVPRAQAPVAWVAVFLFPGIFLYDSALSVAADHVTAFFAVPVFLALLRVWRRPTWRSGALLAVVAGGAVLTKYQGVYLLAAPALALALRAGWRSLRSLRRDGRLDAVARGTWLALGAALAAGMLVTTPHWLKNWVFYGNPVFPNLIQLFPLDGFPEGTARIYEVWRDWQTLGWAPRGSLADKAGQTAEALFTFSFVPHDWPPFHGAHPVFGSLFTLSLLVLPFLRNAKRVWGLLGASYIGVLVWFVTLHQDRYLQILLPWMAATVAATIALAWREGWLARLGISLLVAAQVIWGGDVYFFPAHMVTKEPPTVTSSRLIAAGHLGNYAERLHLAGTLFALGRHPDLPGDATVLLHELQERLGLRRPVVSDMPGYQLMLRYELEPSAASLHARLREMGVTHIFLWPFTSHGHDSLGADLRFFDFVFHDTRSVLSIEMFTLVEIPAEAPPAEATTQVAYLGCGGVYERGLHDLAALTIRDNQEERVKAPVPAVEPLAASSVEAIVAAADFLVTDPACPVDRAATRGFSHLAKRGEERLWGRVRERQQSGGRAPLRGRQPVELERWQDRP